MSLVKKVLLTKYINSSRGNWVVVVKSQRDNSFIDLTTSDDNFNSNIIQGWAKEIKIDYS